MPKFDENQYIVKAKVKKEYRYSAAEEWVQGCLVIANDRGDDMRYRIQPTTGLYRFAFPIDPETICRPIGQKDKNHCLIFEHDLCTVDVNAFLFTTQDPDELFEVLWDENTSNYYLTNKDNTFIYTFVDVNGSKCEVVGNAFDKQRNMGRTLFIGDKSEEEIADWLKSNAKFGTVYTTFEDGSKATILISQETVNIYYPDGVITTGVLDEVAEELKKVSLGKDFFDNDLTEEKER